MTTSARSHQMCRPCSKVRKTSMRGSGAKESISYQIPTFTIRSPSRLPSRLEEAHQHLPNA